MKFTLKTKILLTIIEKHGFKSMKGQLILKNYTQVMADNIKHYLGRLKQLVHE